MVFLSNERRTIRRGKIQRQIVRQIKSYNFKDVTRHMPQSLIEGVLENEKNEFCFANRNELGQYF